MATSASAGSRFFAQVLACAMLLAGYAALRPHEAQASPLVHEQASYYADMFHGRQTASGELFDMNGLTAAHRELAFGTRVRVTNLANGRRIIVRINDRGPYYYDRSIDLSYGAARKLHMVDAGVVPVDIKVLHRRMALYGSSRNSGARFSRLAITASF
jgi:rare lipoprotein A